MGNGNCSELKTSGHGERLTKKQDQAIAALLLHPTMSAAASAVGVNVTTLTRWMRVPTFHDSYMSARRDSVSHAIASVQAATSEAVETLRAVMRDTDAPAGSRVAAARTVLDTAIRGIELEDISERLAQLEAAVNARPAVSEAARWGNG